MSHDSREDSTGAIVAFWVFYLVQLVPMILFRAYVLTRLWTWFITPLGAPTLVLMNAIGLQVVWSYLIVSLKTDDEAEKLQKASVTKKWSELIARWVVSGFILFEGWVISQWMMP